MRSPVLFPADNARVQAVNIYFYQLIHRLTDFCGFMSNFSV